jgi:hypothetical protein
MYLNSHIRNKTVLVVGDGIFGALGGQDAPPATWSTFSDKPPKSMFFSTDPVAIDSVMADFLIYELGSGIPATATSYLPLAAAKGLGVYEHSSNPHNPSSYTKITLRKVVV